MRSVNEGRVSIPSMCQRPEKGRRREERKEKKVGPLLFLPAFILHLPTYYRVVLVLAKHDSLKRRGVGWEEEGDLLASQPVYNCLQAVGVAQKKRRRTV